MLSTLISLQRSFFTFSVGLLFACNLTYAQELPDTPAAKRLDGLIACFNENDAEARTQFLDDYFSTGNPLEQRLKIASRFHDEFAPITIEEIIRSDEFTIVAICTTSKDVRLQIELAVSEDDQKINRVGIETLDSEDAEPVPDGMFPLIGEDGKTPEQARGIWLAKGYGFVFDVKDNEVAVYNVTESFAWKQDWDYDLFFKPGETREQAKVTFHALEPGYNLVRLEQLPEQLVRDRQWTPTQVFEAFVDVFDKHYPFFETRNFNWKERVDQIRPTIKDDMSEVKLFESLEALLQGLEDGHVYLSAEIDGEEYSVSSDKMNTIKRIRESFQPSNSFPEASGYIQDWLSRFKTSVVEETLRGEAVVAANEQIIWGRTDDQVGYIAIFGMGGYSYGNNDSQLKELHKVLDEAINELADTDAMIIDVSFNGGGSDFFSMEIASHFADQRRLGFSKWPATEKQFHQDRFVAPRTEVDQQGAMYLKPVYLVTNDLTASAAEIFIMCMRAFPQVKTVGLYTEGALSDILPKSLPNGWELGLSNEIYTDHEGKCHEGPGVPPDFEMEIFNHNDISKIGHFESMQRITQMARDGVSDR